MNNLTATQARIMSRVSVEDRGYRTPCWVSNRTSNEAGYTRMRYLGAMRSTHRVAYAVFVGQIPEGLELDHLCRVRACCRPDHLEPVTHRVNTLRGDTITAHHAAKTHCPQGHAYTPDNLYVWQGDPSKRTCLTCRRARDAARKAA